ncbi:hypothetical protein ASG01_02825 [Chryseobacterium sp. Leaf180]|uniref:TetR family transcriptional regulator C-terminal domain-containing protein n=1 Tax=Chryseobacterium sp. Leaf180 TaxID=1736289 RepID=UPI0006F8B54E|nr:TetR family transcriptional regulator C-terminal domain-containing protein [Chryseobacterium sp. Leaf180]KQR94817.1 hypothetical protein ASG01_02825 [Chryseobacterium sp. Leaf180]
MENDFKVTEEKIFELYGEFLLNHSERPKNVYRFAKNNGFEEQEFYDYFASFEQIEEKMLSNLFYKSIELAAQIEHPGQISAKEELLNVYFIFFENLTMNRSLILMILGKYKLRSTKNLRSLRDAHKNFIQTLNFNEWEMMKNMKGNVREFQEKSRIEGLWLHFLSCIEFWRNDTSQSFEKTDLFIEKTIDTGFELIDNEPLRKVVDLGKFLWKEKFRR